MTSVIMRAYESLRKIFVSGSRLKLLKILFYFPAETYYIRQLVRLTGEEINSVRRELENLREAGVLTSEKRANKIFYQVNSRYRFFQEFLSIVLKTEGLGKEIMQNRQRLGQIKFVAFSFDFARNLPRKDNESDRVDFLIIGSVVLPELGALVRKEEEKRGREINYTVIDEADFRFRKQNRDPFLINFLLEGKVMIIGDEKELTET
jgi:DNA-binding transcriptional ArsR family regulator